MASFFLVLCIKASYQQYGMSRNTCTCHRSLKRIRMEFQFEKKLNTCSRFLEFEAENHRLICMVPFAFLSYHTIVPKIIGAIGTCYVPLTKAWSDGNSSSLKSSEVKISLVLFFPSAY